MRAVLLADTHVRDGGERVLDERVLAAAADADLVLHAGDVTGRDLLHRLAQLAPVHAVLGNNDVGLGNLLPVELSLDLDGVAVALVHDAGPRAGRPARMARRFPGADLVVFGHSHLRPRRRRTPDLQSGQPHAAPPRAHAHVRRPRRAGRPGRQVAPRPPDVSISCTVSIVSASSADLSSR
jgi:putative phosphoesterase